MKTTTAKALLLGMLALAILAGPTVSADAEEADQTPCQVIETMTFEPYVVIHPECVPDVGPFP